MAPNIRDYWSFIWWSPVFNYYVMQIYAFKMTTQLHHAHCNWLDYILHCCLWIAMSRFSHWSLHALCAMENWTLENVQETPQHSWFNNINILFCFSFLRKTSQTRQWFPPFQLLLEVHFLLEEQELSNRWKSLFRSLKEHTNIFYGSVRLQYLIIIFCFEKQGKKKENTKNVFCSSIFLF